MNKAESKYFNTAVKMDEALLELLEKKDFDYITVKEICKKAGVNRSTFYLHYETVDDLLSECVNYTNNKCFEKFGGGYSSVKEKLSSEKSDELIFITPDYLEPYLQFVRDNKRLFKVVLKNSSLMNTEATFKEMFRTIFSPVMDRFNCAEDEKKYIISFYITGLTAIVSEWLKNDCSDPIGKIIGICMKCVFPDVSFGKEIQET